VNCDWEREGRKEAGFWAEENTVGVKRGGGGHANGYFESRVRVWGGEEARRRFPIPKRIIREDLQQRSHQRDKPFVSGSPTKTIRRKKKGDEVN